MKFKILLFIILLGQILFSCAQDFEVAPVKLYFNAIPGESQVKVVTIKNHSDKKASYMLSVSDFIISSDGNQEFRPANSTKNSIANWMSISPSFFDLEPNNERQVSISMQPPMDEDGSRWGIVFVRTASEKTTFEAGEKLSAGITLSPRIAIQIFQTADISQNIKAKIDQLREIPSKDSTERWFSAIVTNLSDIIIPSKVYLIASNMKTAKEHQYKAVQFTSYPKNTQKIILKMPKDLPKGTYALAAILDFGSMVNLEGTQMVIEVVE